MISVCIATYNGERYIQKQIESILPQLDSSDEIVISDDKSKDNTLSKIKEINDARIRVIINEGPHGFTPNFQNAIRHANGDVIFTADQDDVWLDDKVKICMQELEKYDLVVSDAVVVDVNLNVIEKSFWHKRKPFFTFWGNMLKCGHLGCCLAFKKNMLTKLLPFPINYKKCPHDLWIIMIGLAFYNTKFYKSPLIYYRRHSNNVSNAGFKDETSIGFKISYRLYLLIQLIKRIKV